MVEKVIEKVEVTEDNVEDIALAEWKKEQADKEGKTVDEITDPGNIEVIETKEEITEEDDTTDDDTPPDDTKSDDELLEAKEEDLSDDEKTRKEVVVKLKAEELHKEEDLLLAKPEDELTDEEKPLLVEIKEKREKEDKETFELAVKEYAELSKLPEDEARKDMESIHKIRDKYKGDPVELAKAYLNIQRLNSQKDAKIKGLEEQPVQQNVDWKHTINSNALIMDGKKHTREEAINRYREAYPDVTDPLEDDAVVALMAKDCEVISAKEQEAKTGQLKTDADVKRTKILDELPEADKVYKDEIQDLIKDYSPRAILHENFDIQQLVYWAKGQKFDSKIKELTDKIESTKKEYYKLGQSNSKVKTVGIEGSNKTKAKGTISLTDEDKNEAWMMFPDAKDDNECYELYADVMKYKKAITKTKE